MSSSTPLADAFAAAVTEEPVVAPERLDARIAALHARLPQNKPSAAELAVALARSDHLRKMLLAEEDREPTDEGLAEVVLAAAIRAGDARAAAAFDARYITPIPLALAKMKLRAEMLDDVKQLTRVKLLTSTGDRTRLETVVGQGQLEGLVRVTATRIALDLLRAEQPFAPDGASDLLQATGASRDPALEALVARCRAAFSGAFAHAVDGLDQRERNLLRLHFVGKVTLEQLASMYRVHRATVVRWLADARRKVLEGTRAELATRLELPSDELDSLIGLAESGLDVSVERLLRSRAGSEP